MESQYDNKGKIKACVSSLGYVSGRHKKSCWQVIQGIIHY